MKRDDGRNEELAPYPAPGYSKSKSILERLERFRDLVHYDHRHLARAVTPLDELLPGFDVNCRAVDEELKRQINRLIPLVDEDLERARVSDEISYKYVERDLNEPIKKKRQSRRYRLILNYHDLPDGLESYERVIAVIEQGIGAYTDRRDEAEKERFYPHYWLGWLLGLPVVVLQRAGLMSEGAASSLLVAYGWAVRLLFLLVLARLAGVPILEFFQRLLDKFLPAP